VRCPFWNLTTCQLCYITYHHLPCVLSPLEGWLWIFPFLGGCWFEESARKCDFARIFKSVFKSLSQEVYKSTCGSPQTSMIIQASAPFRTRTHVTTIVLAYQGTCTGVNFGEMGDLWWMIANLPIWRLWDKWCDTKTALWLPHCEIQSVLNHISLNKVGKLLEIPLPPHTTNIRYLADNPQKMAPWSLPQTSYWNTWFQNLTLHPCQVPVTPVTPVTPVPMPGVTSFERVNMFVSLECQS